jgi:chromosome segregation ATPase
VLNTVGAAVVVGAAIWLMLERAGLLERLGLVKPKTADALDELQIADRTIERLRSELAEVRAQKVELEKEALAPILELMKQNAEANKQVLDRLAHHNGSFRHVEQSLREVRDVLALHAEGMQALTGTIAELHGLELKPPLQQRRAS